MEGDLLSALCVVSAGAFSRVHCADVVKPASLWAFVRAHPGVGGEGSSVLGGSGSQAATRNDFLVFLDDWWNPPSVAMWVECDTSPGMLW